MANPYSTCIKFSEKSAWVLDDVLAEGFALDTGKQLFPIPKGAVGALKGVGDDEILLISQIMGGNYCRNIHLIEEFIVDQTLRDLAAKKPEAERIRALCRLADEEVKHQALFDRFTSGLDRALGRKIEVPDAAAAYSTEVLKHSPLAIWLLALHMEVVTLRHYTEIFNSGPEIDPSFLAVLKAHAQEEAQHVKVDTLEVGRLVAGMSEKERQQGVQDYVSLLKITDRELARSNRAVFANFSAFGVSQLPPAALMELENFFLGATRNLMIYVGLKSPLLINAVKGLNLGFENRLAEIPAMIESQSAAARAA